MSFDKHSCFTERTQRSANAFGFGLRAGRGSVFLRQIAALAGGLTELRVAIVEHVAANSEMAPTVLGGVMCHLLHLEPGVW